MVIKNILFLILFILPISVFAYEKLQPPISPSTKQNCQYISESSNKQAHKDKYDTEPLKTKIKEIISQQKTKSNRDQDQSWYNTFFDHPTEWLLVLFNGLLAWFTFHLWRSNIHLWQVSQEQSGHMKSSLAIAQKSAEAAEKAVHATRETANVMRAQDRAYIFVKIELDKSTKSKNDIKKMQFDGLIGDVTANIKMINHGKTPAIIKSIRYKLDFSTMEGLVDYFTRLRTTKSIVTPEQDIIEAGKESKTYPCSIFIDESEQQHFLNRDNVDLLCVGFIEYEDVFGNLRITRFCWEFKPFYTDFYISEKYRYNERT